MNLVAKKKDEKGFDELFDIASLPPPLRILGEALKKIPIDKLKEAQKKAEEIIKGNLSWTELFSLPPERLRQIAEYGYEQFKSGVYEGAVKIFKGLTVIDPENYYYHQMLGAGYQRQEKYPDAILQYSIAADLNEKDTVSLTNRGECYMKLGLYPLANEDFDKTIALDPKGEDRWGNRSRMLKEQVHLILEGKKGKKKK